MIDGARVEVAPYKRDPADFVLWKPSTPEQPGWDSPFGRGRPGWHIECSAMAAAHLGTTVDIHGGGQDLKFPHHENELAQSDCAHDGAPLARFWLHNGYLDIAREKNSKSLGNVLLVSDLLAEAPGVALRFALLTAHYRKPLDWSEDGLARARQSLDRLYLTLRDLPGPAAPEPDAAPSPSVLAALEDDLNTPQAFAKLRALARQANASDEPARRRELKAQLLASGRLLGLLQEAPESWLQTSGASALEPAEIDRLIAARAAARKARDFAAADRLRDELVAAGVILEDSAEGTRWRIAGRA
jgi:cysteinyl-tRNA synthetase